MHEIFVLIIFAYYFIYYHTSFYPSYILVFFFGVFSSTPEPVFAQKKTRLSRCDMLQVIPSPPPPTSLPPP